MKKPLVDAVLSRVRRNFEASGAIGSNDYRTGYFGLKRRSGSYGLMKQEPKGLIYTIMAGDQPIVALEASGREAGQLCKEEWFKSELAALKSDGEPACGSAFRLRARPATEEERRRYREGYKNAKATDLTLVYLIQLDDP